MPEFGEVEITFIGGNTDVNLYTKADGSSGMDKRFNEQVVEHLEMPLPSGLPSFISGQFEPDFLPAEPSLRNAT